MNTWKRSLFWEGLPLVMVLGVFGLIAIINWDYESKLLETDPSADNWNSIHLGQILFVIALGQASLGSVILLVIRLLNPGITSKAIMFLPLSLVFILLILPGIFIVVLGPASITMIQQMRVAPR